MAPSHIGAVYPGPRSWPRMHPLDDSWALWPVAALRSAGLPAARALELAGPPERVTAAIERFVRDAWCREAVARQNPSLVENWLGDYARRLAGGDRSLSTRG